jgi:hypothetical protein
MVSTSVGEPNHAHAFAGEDLIKGGRELGVPIAEQEPGPQPGALERPDEVAGLLRHPGRRRMGSAAAQMDPAAADLEEEEDVQPLQPGGFHREEVPRPGSARHAAGGSRTSGRGRAGERG